jgi:hypothetical protein
VGFVASQLLALAVFCACLTVFKNQNWWIFYFFARVTLVVLF